MNTKYIWSFKLKHQKIYSPKRLYISELHFSALAEQNKKANFHLWAWKGGNDQKKIRKNWKFQWFLCNRPQDLLFLGLNGCLVECATVCVKSVVILTLVYLPALFRQMKDGFEINTPFRKKLVYGHPSSTRYDGWLHSREFQWKFVISKEKDMHQKRRRS